MLVSQEKHSIDEGNTAGAFLWRMRSCRGFAVARAGRTLCGTANSCENAFRTFRASSLLLLTHVALVLPCASCSRPASGAFRVGAVETHTLASSDRTAKIMGIRIGCEIDPVPEEAGRSRILAGDNLRVRFSVSDTTTGAPLTGARPGAWIHPRLENHSETCQDKIESWVAGTLVSRAEYDLNEFYVLVLNDEPSISVIDPLFGYGGSKLLSLIGLPAVGEDWVLSEDRSRLYVSTPTINQVVVINTATWKMADRIDVGVQPTRLRLQPDGKYLWVSCTTAAADTDSVYVVDTDTAVVAARFAGGDAHHEFAFSTDSLVAYIADAGLASVTVVDTQRLHVLSVTKVGQSTGDVAYSPLSRCAYVVDSVGGSVAVLDGGTHKVVRRVSAEPGLSTLRTAPGGRYLLVANERTATVDVIDVVSDEVIQTADVGPEPDQIIFTLSLAYIRSRGSDLILMIPLEQLGSGDVLSVADFTGGHAPFGLAATTSIADGLASAPGGLAAVVANPVDKSIYYYREGMAAPMGSFQSYGREPRAVLVVDRSLRESPPGEYQTSVRIDEPGVYDVAFFLDVPRILHCFELVVADTSDSAHDGQAGAVTIESIAVEGHPSPGEPVTLRYSANDSATGEPVESLDDFGVLVFCSRNWQQRTLAKSVGQGIYEATFEMPEAGVYHVYCQVPSLDLEYRDLPLRVLRVQ